MLIASGLRACTPRLLRAFVAVVPLTASCASSGFYYMSDDWCGRHVDAGAARCPGSPERAHPATAEPESPPPPRPQPEIAQRDSEQAPAAARASAQ
ncbi:MAG TPA: hypothetical protein VMT66_02460 [Steroidobacteraceae bacterium]|nr:hypothetical protein [Steroidobacteraceae bacterium]